MHGLPSRALRLLPLLVAVAVASCDMPLKIRGDAPPEPPAEPRADPFAEFLAAYESAVRARSFEEYSSLLVPAFEAVIPEGSDPCLLPWLDPSYWTDTPACPGSVEIELVTLARGSQPFGEVIVAQTTARVFWTQDSGAISDVRLEMTVVNVAGTLRLQRLELRPLL